MIEKEGDMCSMFVFVVLFGDVKFQQKIVLEHENKRSKSHMID